MFVPALQLLSTDLTRYDYVQATDAGAMESFFAQFLKALIAENVERATQKKPPLNVVDVELAGGDGHTFVLRLLVTTANPSTAWLAADLARVQLRCWMGSSAEALQDYQEAAIASLTTAGTLSYVAVGHAGAKGTRFMAFMAAKITPPD